MRCIISFNLGELRSLEKGFGAEKLPGKSGVVEFNVGIVNWGVVPCRGSPIVVTNVVAPRRHVGTQPNGGDAGLSLCSSLWVPSAGVLMI